MRGDKSVKFVVAVDAAEGSGIQTKEGGKLGWREFGITSDVIVSEGVVAIAGTKQSEVGSGEAFDGCKGNERGSDWWANWWSSIVGSGSVVERVQNILLGNDGRGGLRESKAKFDIHNRKCKRWVSGFGVDARAKSEIKDTRGMSGKVVGNCGNQFAISVVETKTGEKVVNSKEGGFDAGGDGAGFKCRIMRTPRNVGKRHDEFSRAVN
jgi:hypothetical protein